MRCHCAFWDKDDFTQDWVKALHGDALRSAISTRIQGVTSHVKGMYVNIYLACICWRCFF